MPKTVICTPTNVSFSVGGTNCAVTSIELCLAVNTVPYATVVIAPAAKAGEYKIDNLSVAESAQMLMNFYKLADNLTPCNLSFTLQEAGGTSQSINISGWLLTTVSPITVSQMQGFTIACRIHHPAYRLLRYGYYGGNLDTPLPYNFSDPGCSNLVNAADIVLDQLKSADKRTPQFDTPDAPFASSYAEISSHIDTLLGKIPPPSTYISFSSEGHGSSLPVNDVVSQITTADGVAARNIAMCMSVTPSGNESMWDALLSASELWGCSILPTYTQQKLTMTPTAPWGKPVYNIVEGQIYSLSLPAHDANPLVGVKANAASGGPLLSATSQPAEKDLVKNKLDEWTYIPSGCIGDMANGRLMEVSTPPWVSIIEFACQALRSCKLSGDSDPGSDVSVKNPFKNMGEFLYAAFCHYAAYVFQLRYKQKYRARVVCPLNVAAGIIPGRSLSITSSGGSVILNGYVCDVIHSIDMHSVSAMTTIDLSHCRQDGGYKQIVPEGTKNPLYK